MLQVAWCFVCFFRKNITTTECQIFFNMGLLYPYNMHFVKKTARLWIHIKLKSALTYSPSTIMFFLFQTTFQSKLA